jgi:hypothetical protein
MLIDIAELSGQEASPSWMLIDIAELSGQEARPQQFALQWTEMPAGFDP